MPFCYQCGNEVTDIARFCGQCGKPVGPPQEAPSPAAAAPQDEEYPPLDVVYGVP
jgi:predicted amidophosphoribosyltransferase